MCSSSSWCKNELQSSLPSFKQQDREMMEMDFKKRKKKNRQPLIRKVD
jgi:hypothetical protein